MSDVTQLLQAGSSGDPKAAEELLPLVYDELRRLAAQKMAGEARAQTLQPTALVHEAWLRLAGEAPLSRVPTVANHKNVFTIVLNAAARSSSD